MANPTVLAGLKLAAPEDDPEIQAPAALESEGDGLAANVLDYAREHPSELFTSEVEVPTRFRDLLALRGPITPNTYYVSRLLTGNEFSDETVEGKNYRTFMQWYEDAPGVYPVVGPHNAYAVAVRLNVVDEDMLFEFEAFDDYPGVSEEKESGGVEEKSIDDAWQDWASMAFERALTNKFPDFEQTVETLSAPALKALFEKMRQRVKVDWQEDEGHHAFIDVDSIANAAIPEDFGGNLEVEPKPEPEPETKKASLPGDTIENCELPERERCNDVDPDLCCGGGYDSACTCPDCHKPTGYAEHIEKRFNHVSSETASKIAEVFEKVLADEFVRAYFEAALFSTEDDSNDNGGELFDKNYGIKDFDLQTAMKMAEDCHKFQAECAAQLVDEAMSYPGRYSPEQRGGFDFWLTRNGHGVGFWDGSWQKPAAEILTNMAHKYGEFNLEIGEDGKIHHIN